MTVADWVILALALLMAVQGFMRGFVVAAFSLVGFIIGSMIGTRLGPLVLSQGNKSPYAVLFGLAGALILGLLLGALCEAFAQRVRRLMIFPGMRFVDELAGALLTGCIGLGIAWIIGAVVLQSSEQSVLPKPVVSSIRQSVILTALNELLPPSGSLLHDLARIDPFPTVDGPLAAVSAPNPKSAEQPGVKSASGSVVRIIGTACGLGIEGSGWVAAPHAIVTNAHVVAGERNTMVQPDGRGPVYKAQVIYFDPHNDVAVLHVPGIYLKALSMAGHPQTGESAAVLGYPLNGPFNVQPARLGDTQALEIQNAYGDPTVRTVSNLRGLVRPGNSGGPMIDASGQVLGTVFAQITSAPKDKPGGYAVPNSVVRSELKAALAHPHTVSTQSCAE